MSGHPDPLSLKGNLSYSRARDEELGLRSQDGENLSPNLQSPLNLANVLWVPTMHNTLGKKLRQLRSRLRDQGGTGGHRELKSMDPSKHSP